MNHIHRLVWNTATSTWVAVAENARGRGKGSSRKLVAAALSLTLAASLVQAAPAGGAVTSGAGTISQAGAVTTIQQATPNLSLNWNSFNVGKSETVNFVQPSASAVAVNRILDTNASQILGRLNANGQVYLINPNGILFGQGSVVNVSGLFASSTGANAFITNNGSLIANGGSIKLEAANVVNTGLIQAQTIGTQQGSIILLGNMSTGTTTVGGTLDASAPNGGNGGFIDTSAAHVKFIPGFHITTAASIGKTGTWLIDPVDFTIAASGGDITGALLGSLLSSNSITVQAVAGTATATNLVGATAGTGNVNVNDAVTWAANTLTLKADNNIYINANLNGGAVGSTAKLVLEFGQGAAAGATNTSNYILKPLQTWSDVSTVGNNNFQAVVSLPAGKNFSTKLGSNGATVDYTVITELGVMLDATLPTSTTLQSLAVPANLGGNFVLGADIVALPTVTIYNGIRGFIPIGAGDYPFIGNFDGLGHTVSDLYINIGATANAGLFGATAGLSKIQNVGLLRGSVNGGESTGALVGFNKAGAIFNSFSTGNVNGAAFTGGLVGQNIVGSISNSYATGNVVGDAYTGGLVGGATDGMVTDSYADGSVHGAAGTGGLVGTIFHGTVANSYATGDVLGGAGTGGLVGTSVGPVLKSYATGSVTGKVGGVVTNPGSASVGGLVGSLDGLTGGYVSESYASGAVTGADDVGGLIGISSGFTINTYASGKVSGSSSNVGGLIGSSSGPVQNSYASGAMMLVTGMTTLGAFMGASSATNSGNFFAAESNPGMKGIVAPAYPGGVIGMSNQDMKQQANFTTSTTANKPLNPDWNFSNTWLMYDGLTSPLLRAVMVPLVLTGKDFSKTYDGNSYPALTAASYFVTPPPALAGTLSFSFLNSDLTAHTGPVENAGSYTVMPIGLQSTQKYAVTYAGGKLTINPASLVISAVTDTKIYDGSMASNKRVSVIGLMPGDTITAIQEYVSKNVLGTNLSTLQVNAGYAINDGNATPGGNYLVTTNNTAPGTITAKPVGLKAPSVTKSYDGSLFYTTQAADLLDLSNQLGVSGDTVSAATLVYLNKNVGQSKTVNLTAVTLNDGNAGDNYKLLSLAGNSTSSITPAAISSSISTTGSRVYDDTLDVAASILTLSGLFDGETLTLSGMGKFLDKNAGINKPFALGTLILSDGTDANAGSASNYSFTGGTHTATITQAALAISAVTDSKIYDGGMTSNKAVIVTGLVGSDTVTGATQAFASKNVLGTGVSTLQVNTGFTINDGNTTPGGNYSVKNNAAPGSITAKAVTLTAPSVSKTYDALLTYSMQAAELSALSSQLSVAGDSVSVATLAYLDKNVASNQAVTLRGVTLDDGNPTPGANYNPTLVGNNTSSITQAALAINAAMDSKTYDGALTSNKAVTFSGLVGSDTVTGATQSFTSKNVLGTGASTLQVNTGFTINDGNTTPGGNYLVTNNPAPGSIIAKAVTLTAPAITKTYDASLTYSTQAAELSALSAQLGVAGDSVSAATLAYLDKNVASNKVVALGGVTLVDGNPISGDNYSVFLNTSQGTIAAKALTAKLALATKVYDGTTTAEPKLTITEGMVGSETVIATGVGNYNSKDVTASQINVNAVTLSNGSNGGLASNYILDPIGLSGPAIITPRSLVVKATGVNKVYDGNTVATVGFTDDRISNDKLSLSYTGAAFSDKNVAINKSITIFGLALLGPDKANYALLQPGDASADILRNRNIRPYAIDVATPFSMSSTLKVSQVFSANASSSEEATPFGMSNGLKVTRVDSAGAGSAEENTESSEIWLDKNSAILQIVDGGIRLPSNILYASEEEKRRQIKL